ncbi:Glutathione S-transferase omega-2 [Actinomortierella ambigua]|nr:Glutathione S-transferase omega-2 [Actinomortierella ambigua]
MTFPKLTLYTTRTFPAAQNVHVVLKETGLDAEIVDIDLSRPRPDWFLKLSPYGAVPVLKIGDDQVLLEAPAIARYLAELAPEKKLIPSSPIERAHSEFVPLQYVNHLGKAFFELAYTKDATKRDANLAHFLKELEIFQNYLIQVRETSVSQQHQKDGPYLHGAQFSLADAALGGLINRFWLAEVHQPGFVFPTKESHPQFSFFFDWVQAVTERPSVKETTPDRESITRVSYKFLH